MKRDLTCIMCPVGCDLQVELENKLIRSVTGNNCKAGEKYARQEVLNPMRNIASSVLVINGNHSLVSVRLSRLIPRNQILNVMEEIKKIKITAPIKIGDVIQSNICLTGSDVIATKNVETE